VVGGWVALLLFFVDGLVCCDVQLNWRQFQGILPK
jgi:hypothetical protein